MSTPLYIEMQTAELEKAFPTPAAAATFVVALRGGGHPIRVRQSQMKAFFRYARKTMKLKVKDFERSSESALLAYKESLIPATTPPPTNWTGQ